MANKYLKTTIAILASIGLWASVASANTADTGMEVEQEQTTESPIIDQDYDQEMEQSSDQVEDSMERQDIERPDLEQRPDLETQQSDMSGEMDSTGLDTTSPAAEGARDEAAATMNETEETAVDTVENTERQLEQQASDMTTPSDLSQSQVKSLQESLNSATDSNLQTDGIFGPRTRDSLRQYQQANNLEVTGELNQETMNALGMSDSTDTTRRPASVEPAEPTTPAENTMDTMEPGSELEPTPDTEMQQEQEEMEREQSYPMNDRALESDIETEQSFPTSPEVDDSSLQSDELNNEVNQ